MSDQTVPTDQARALVAGGYDTHVHVAPDVMTRRIDDVDLARRFRDVGLTGFVLKSHYVSTAERAAVVRKAVPGVDALGAITLNGAVGGVNPVAVEIAGREGARLVWLPTVDSRNHQAMRASIPSGATQPMWAQLQDELAAQGIVSAPVEVLDTDGRVRMELRRTFAVMAKYDMVLATGHLSGTEAVRVVPAAFEEGVRRVVVTHPEFPSQRLDTRIQRDLARQGALLERCFTTPHTGKIGWTEFMDVIKQVGVEHSVLSSDLGQPFNPPVEDGLALMADHLLGAGFTEDEVRVMAVDNTRLVAAAKDPDPAVK